MGKRMLILSILVMIAQSCKKDLEKKVLTIESVAKDNYYKSEIFHEKNKQIYEKWKLYGVSGGFHGRGHEINFDYLEMKPFGIYGFIRNDSILEYGKVVIVEQTGESLLIRFDKDANSETFMSDPEKFVNFHGNDTLSLDSPCCDRYNYHFDKD